MSPSSNKKAASIVFAAGKGSRMTGYSGNKTLLPLIPDRSLYEGERPLLHEVLSSLPEGPKGLVVHHCAEEVKKAARGFDVEYLLQPETNGTGGALLASRPFVDSVSQDRIVITMGDVPLIRPSTYLELVSRLDDCSFVILVFAPEDRAQYGMVEMDGQRVLRIVEWKYWSVFPPERQELLKFCNAGVYAARRSVLSKYLDRLANMPHEVKKQRGDQWVTIKEYFLTDLVELLVADGLTVGVVEAASGEVTGVDTPEALRRVQAEYAATVRSGR